MKIAIVKAVTLVVLSASSLLLVFAANCSFGERGTDAGGSPCTEATALAEQSSSTESGPVVESDTAEPPSMSSKEEGVCEANVPSSKANKADITTTNAYCAACHYGFDEEEFALSHELAGVGCERCHGESMRHRSDENNLTPPEIMWPASKVNPMCMMCHPRDHIKHVSHHKELLAATETVFDPEIDDGSDADGASSMRCTTCHSKTHRLNVRSIRWNKMTGELLGK